MIDHDVDLECSIGDYVLSGGELPAMALIDAITRLQPGALGDGDSAEQDSFSDGLLIAITTPVQSKLMVKRCPPLCKVAIMRPLHAIA